MNSHTFINLLTEHADALNATGPGSPFDSSAWRSARIPEGDSSILIYLRIAEAIKQVLVPVSVSTAFRAQLRQELANGSPRLRSNEKRSKQWVLIIGAAAIGVLVFAFRRLKPNHSENQSQAITAVA